MCPRRLTSIPPFSVTCSNCSGGGGGGGGSESAEPDDQTHSYTPDQSYRVEHTDRVRARGSFLQCVFTCMSTIGSKDVDRRREAGAATSVTHGALLL